jgi:mannose-6-phosphate isomerase-like protein (cupin superfamily)
LTAYKLVTANAGRAATVAQVPAVVDAAISAAIARKRPAYIEINMAIWNSACPMPGGPLAVNNPPAGTEHQLATTIVGLIRAAQSPVILLGTEIQRYGLADKVADLIAKLGIRWASALLAKSTLPEEGPGWVGVYDPPHSHATVQNVVEHADLLVTLGCVFPNGYAALVQSAFGRMVQVYDSKRPGAHAAVIWTTEGFPVDNDGSGDASGHKVGTTLDNGTVFRVVSFGPGVTPRNHRTDSIDYATVISGEIDMELDGTSVHLKAGDVLVQRGTSTTQAAMAWPRPTPIVP